MAGLPWFKVYAREMLADSRFSSWTMDERGAWLTLLLHNWHDGSIPAGVTQIARLLHVEAGEASRIWSAIGDRFSPHPSEPGRLVSPRLEDERDKADALITKRGRAGEKGASARWSKKKKPHGKRMRLPSQTDGTRDSKPMAKEWQGDAKPDSQKPACQPPASSLQIPDSQKPETDRLTGDTPEPEPLLLFRSALAEKLGLSKALTVGRDRDTVVACFTQQLAAVGEDQLLAECVDLANRSVNGTPTSLAWFVGWLQRLPVPASAGGSA